ncbi:MAG TPA: AraC family transcriptional regulator ligand-binding domain-containing protein [Sphingopyxis sp.]|nr:AraC family transcriptional regulator ligand-binding domain-containing protein [Sphingopyxis sp.]HMP46044.1 AraC family transcriptional regulator ligand-binding domain-containing protein [Sphingopyxis sp.]HMQ20404.1 AraC family transcriptional regulator ligand-binding domain-containing protein [Sphingopyxis sp.]
MATIDGYYFGVCTKGAERAGKRVGDLVAGTGLDPRDFARPGWRGSAGAMALLVRNIWASLDDEMMGYASRPAAPGSFAFACELALEGRDVADGLARAARFYNLLGAGIETRIAPSREGLEVAVRFAEPGRDPDHYFSEFWMIIWHRLACWLAGETISLLSAEFDYPRPEAYFEEFKYLFPCRHRFEGDARRIVMDAHALHAPIRRTAAELEAMIAAAPLDIMTIPASDASVARQVRQYLTRSPDLTLGELAHATGLSPHKLRRLLREEGTALATIRENVRRDKAVRMLTGGNATVEAIAEALGYAEARSFTRAFRQWTGRSPSAWRAGVGDGRMDAAPRTAL